MKPRPKVGDHVGFQYRDKKVGEVIAVAITGVHFLIKYPVGKCKYAHKLIGINAIIEILPKAEPILLTLFKAQMEANE
ncbi:hypothetical protein ES707_10071 [subsurface metagenome]